MNRLGIDNVVGAAAALFDNKAKALKNGVVSYPLIRLLQ
jgi:hypothetical protein